MLFTMDMGGLWYSHDGLQCSRRYCIFTMRQDSFRAQISDCASNSFLLVVNRSIFAANILYQEVKWNQCKRFLTIQTEEYSTFTELLVMVTNHFQFKHAVIG